MPTSAETGKQADEALVAVREMEEARARDAERKAAELQQQGG